MCIPDRAHLIHDSLGPRESDAERRVDTFSRFRSARGRDQQTDQPPYVVTSLPGELLDTLLTTAAPYCTLHAWIAAREASNKCIAVSKVATPLRNSHSTWDHTSVTCHPAEVTFPPLPQPKLVLD